MGRIGCRGIYVLCALCLCVTYVYICVYDVCARVSTSLYMYMPCLFLFECVCACALICAFIGSIVCSQVRELAPFLQWGWKGGDKWRGDAWTTALLHFRVFDPHELKVDLERTFSHPIKYM